MEVRLEHCRTLDRVGKGVKFRAMWVMSSAGRFIRTCVVFVGLCMCVIAFLSVSTFVWKRIEGGGNNVL